MPTKKQSTTGKIAGGLGLAALAAGAAATYYFYGQGGKKHRKAAADWSKKAKTDMVEKIKKMEKVSKASYDQAAAEIMAKYKQVKNIDPKELVALGQELKGHWDKISKDLTKLVVVKKPAPKKKTAVKKQKA